MGKRQFAKPALERHCKKYALQRRQRRQRQLRDMLNDPVLVTKLEQQCLRATDGDKEAVSQRMERLRRRAAEQDAGEGDHDDDKGREKPIAAKWLLDLTFGTVFAIIVWWLIWPVSYRNELLLGASIRVFFFCGVHLLDSYRVYQLSQHRLKSRRVARSKNQSELEEPLIATTTTTTTETGDDSVRGDPVITV